MYVRFNGAYNADMKGLYRDKHIWIGVDPSKTNSGMVVGDDKGIALDAFEFDGTNDGTTLQATFAEAKKIRIAIKEIFEGAIIDKVGIENPISKMGGGMYYHEVRLKLTHIFDSFVIAFYDNFDIVPTLVDNKSWKGTILPTRLSDDKVKKGSYIFLKEQGNRFGQLSNDVSDAYCILQYLYKVFKVTEPRMITANMADRHCKINLGIGDSRVAYLAPMKLYNSSLTFMDNCRKAVSDCNKVILKTPVNAVPYKLIWTNLIQPFEDFDSDICYVYLEVADG